MNLILTSILLPILFLGGLGPMEIFVILITLGLLLIPQFFYLMTLQSTIKEINSDNRKIQPNEIWLILIPLLGFIWHFIIINRMADSLKAEFTQRNIANDEERPGYSIGLAYCILFCCSIIPAIGGLAFLGGFVCWIIYWVKINGYKLKLQQNRHF